MMSLLSLITRVIALNIIMFSDVSCSSSLKVVMLGDWGGLPIFPYKTFVELSVGREMSYLASKFGVDFILALGDNFYLDGVKDVDDPRFKETFETAFGYESLHVPWFLIAGNHDHYGNVSAQLAYSSKSDRWHFPALYYKKNFKVPLSNFTVDIVMTDSIILCGNTDPAEPYKQPLFDSVNLHKSKKHWEWLEDVLKSSKAHYLLVCGHYPVYSIGSHGNTNCLVKYLKPLLEKYNVSAYLSGHEHNMQHIQVQDIDYIISGSANFIDPSKKHIDEIPPKSLLFHWGNPFSLGAFAYIDINEKNMSFTFLKSSGKILYSYSKSPRPYLQ